MVIMIQWLPPYHIGTVVNSLLYLTLLSPSPSRESFFLLLGRIASMLPITEDIAFRVNLLSPISSAFAVMFLYLVIVLLVANWKGGIKNYQDSLVSFGGGVIGSLTFAFTDSHWFNAVEAEVYAFSTFFYCNSSMVDFEME